MPLPISQSDASLLIRDLTKVPHIIGGLGLSIAAAQKAFNLDYLNNIERLLALIKMLLGGKKLDENGDVVEMSEAELQKLDGEIPLLKDLLAALAPPRYQYSETTLSVRLDLAQTMDVGANVGLGLGYGGIAINAAFSIGYGYDYRAAAECKTVIHAIPADRNIMDALMNRAKEINDRTLELPAVSEVDRQIIDQAGNIFQKMLDVKPALDTTV